MLLEAKPLVEERVKELRDIVSNSKNKPTLAIVKVGCDKASEKYVNNKIKLCERVGINSKVVQIDSNVSDVEVEKVIEDLNKDDKITGILLQLPLPKHLNEKKLTNLIVPSKDVDGFTHENFGKLMCGEKGLRACTPKGIMKLLDYYKIDLEGKDVLIINRSNIVGKPLALMMMERNATVTIAHSKTKNLVNKVKSADVVVLGVGIKNFVGTPHFKNGATIIDVSINFDENNKLCGDVSKADYEDILKKDCNLTPVPGGVGLTTVLSLIEQTIEINK